MLYQFWFDLYFVIIVESILVPTIFFSTEYLQKWPSNYSQIIFVIYIEITVWLGMGNMNWIFL